MSKLNITIPFPVWDTIYSSDYLLDIIRETEFVPSFMTPRRMTVKEVGGNSLNLKIQFWVPGAYLDVWVNGSEDSHYGTSWEVKKMNVRWKESDEQKKIKLGADEIALLNVVKAAKSNLEYASGWKNHPSIPKYEKKLKEAKKQVEDLVKKLLK